MRDRRLVRFELRLYPDERRRLGEVARTLGCSLSEFARLAMNTCAAEMQEGADLFDRRRSLHPVPQERRRAAGGRRAYDAVPVASAGSGRVSVQPTKSAPDWGPC